MELVILSLSNIEQRKEKLYNLLLTMFPIINNERLYVRKSLRENFGVARKLVMSLTSCEVDNILYLKRLYHFIIYNSYYNMTIFTLNEVFFLPIRRNYINEFIDHIIIINNRKHFYEKFRPFIHCELIDDVKLLIFNILLESLEPS